MNSPLLWAFMWRNAQHGKDEALRLFNSFTESLPIAEPIPAIRHEVEEGVTALIRLTREAQDRGRELLDWLRFDLGVEKPGQKLEAFAELTADDFVAEVRERRPNGASRLTPAAIAELMKTHQGYAVPERQRAAEIQSLEHRLSDLINQAYGLTDEEIALLWKTAPPRMPNARRTRSVSSDP